MESKFFVKNSNTYKVDSFSEEDILGVTNVYEVIRIIDGIALFEENHLARMEKSLNIAGYNGSITIDNIKENLKKLIKANNGMEGNVKVIINKEKDESFFYYIPHSYPTNEMYKEGVDTILYHGERKNPNAKIIDNSFRDKVKKEMDAKGVYEAILVDRNGNITEGSKSNIFMVKDGVIITSPLSEVLPGVTRGEIIELAQSLNISVEERVVNYKEVRDLDGLFISGTSPKILPIKKVDSLMFYSSNNDIIFKLMTNFNKKIKNYIERRK